ncbi:hypothetical protein N7495_008806 [Penicillium taxi]|uniref:uncharacterized protein n=1 Tax=Penicillium taxi TaxID=168475 RepID=UPI0025458D20|nr:uncharacterized protein N7495_008806 [Penicillium taxi]KAJ5888765.1 hypothetical protein N7495_008806 [Penicillium taxi]
MPDETEPLLPRYEDDTPRQRQLHQKLHSYQMIRAMSEGYMPSTEQTIANLRTLLASDVLNFRNQDIGSVGRQLARDARLWVEALINFLYHKNNQDQLQEFLWRLSQSRASLDGSRVSQHAAHVKSRADTKAAYESFRTVGSLLLTNADFRLFVDDVATVGRQIFADTATSLSEISKNVAEEVKPSEFEAEALNGAGADEGHDLSREEVQEEIAHAVAVTGKGAADTGLAAVKSAKEHLAGQERETLLYRLKKVVTRLRERSDYSDSVSTLTQLVQRYALIYANAAEDATTAAQEDIHVNDDLKQAVENFWQLVRSFGHAEEWDRLQEKFHNVLRHANKDPEFERLMGEVGGSLKDMLTDPEFFDSAPKKLEELQQQSEKIGSETSLRQDLDEFLAQAKRSLQSVPEDPLVVTLINATKKFYHDAYTAYNESSSDLPANIANVLFPVLLRTIQYVPIPRLEVSAPEMDLLLENLILEPGHTVNFSSFLPYRLHLQTRNDIEVMKKHSKRTDTSIRTIFQVTIQGLNVSAKDFGYWFKTHASFFRLRDEGIASFYLDRRGVDISLDVEVGRGRVEEIFTLRSVRVRIHKLDYTVDKSKWKFLLWLTRPFLKPLIRRVLEKKIAEEIVNVAHALNRELVFARERLRATRIANPQDLATFIRAVLARLKPADNLDVEARIGLDTLDSGVFKGVYAPGSIVKTWHEEATRAQEAIEEGDENNGLGHTWRNDIFDVAGTR